MHRKKPRRQSAIVPENLKKPFIRRLPPPPAAGIKRGLTVFAAYGGATIIISILAVMSAVTMAWIFRGSSIWSGPGLAFNIVGVAVVVWPAMYLIGGLESWRKGKR
jgi:hypothetical protein